MEINLGPLIYALCQKPVVGLLLFVTSACAFPPLFQDEPLPLQQTGARIQKEFSAPVSKPYYLSMRFEFPSAASIRADEVVGSRYDVACQRDYADLSEAQKADLGRPIPIRIRVQEKQTGKVVVDTVFHSLCKTASGGTGFSKYRTAGRLDLAQGDYIAVISNVAGQAGLDGVKTTVALVPGHGK